MIRMLIDYKDFVLKVKQKEESGEWDRQTAFRARNMVAAISGPRCPPKLAATYARIVNQMFGEQIVKGF
jgi:hypothetical protein